MLTATGRLSSQVRKLRELLPRHEGTNLFDSTKHQTLWLQPNELPID